MYHPSITDRRLTRLADEIRSLYDPTFQWRDHTVAQIEAWNERLLPLFNPESATLSRVLDAEEQAFVNHEQARCKVDFRYWLTRHACIKTKRSELNRVVPSSVQDILLAKIGEAEQRAIDQKTGDGVLFLILKARQLGVSTLSDLLVAHRVFNYAHTTAMIAADVEDRTPNLYEIVVRCYDYLPWYLQPRSLDPKRDYRVKGKQLSFGDQDSIIRFSSSANKQGGASGEIKGSLGTGMTLPLVHLSEVALFANPSQIDDALEPSIPHSDRTLVLFESTAKGRDNWWFDVWGLAKRGIGRYKPVFIPWYTDPETYTLPAPLDWSPSNRALAHAERVRLTSHHWVGKDINLTKDQLFWWEQTYTAYRAKRELFKFLAEYASDDEEAFQNTTQGIFPTELIDDLRRASRDPIFVRLKSSTWRERPETNPDLGTA